MQSQTADAELKLHNATQRLQRLEQDVLLLRDKSVNVTLSSNLTNQDAENIQQVATDLKHVSSPLICYNLLVSGDLAASCATSGRSWW